MDIKTNIDLLRNQLRPSGARLVAVSKNQPVERIREAYAAGQRIFGENRVQELRPKYEALPKDIAWHVIGHLQSNKVKFIAPFVALIHSVDSMKLLHEINKQGQKINRPIPCLLQVYIAQEETKFGWDRHELTEAVRTDAFRPFPFAKIEGLMGIASLTEDQAQIENELKTLHTLFEEIRAVPARPSHLEMKELSSGMSNDYRLALAHGSTLVRIGTAIFGTRNPASL